MISEELQDILNYAEQRPTNIDMDEETFVGDYVPKLISFIRDLREKLANAKACIVDQDIGAKAEWQGKIQDLQAENERLVALMPHVCATCEGAGRIEAGVYYDCHDDGSVNFERLCHTAGWRLKNAK